MADPHNPFTPAPPDFICSIPCWSPGCQHWFYNNSGLTKHMQAKHSIPTLPWPEHPNFAPWLFDNIPPAEDFDAPLGGDLPVKENGEGFEWEHHALLCTTPCNETGEYLPQGTPLSPPPIWSPNDWAPYHDCMDFELTEFLYTKVQMLGKSIDTLSQLWCASLINHGIHPDDINLFKQNNSLLATINATPVGDVPWEGFSMSYDSPRPLNTPEWMTTTHNVWFHNPQQLMHNLLANWDFDGEFDYKPFQEFDTQRGDIERMSGGWAWKEVNIIANDPDTHGLLLVPIILGSDKTTVSVATGQNEYYPIYLLISNVHNNVRCAHRNAVVLLGLLAIPKTDKQHTDDHEYRSLGPYIADYPEQALLACMVQGWCPRYAASVCAISCTTQSEGLVKLTNVLVNTVDSDTLWYQYGIVANVTPFTSEFPWADIHEIIAPDILHQVIKGTFKDHLVLWVKLYLVCMCGMSKASAILDDIDHRIALAPSFPGLRSFPQGCSFKQWTGDNLKALMKVYLPSLEGHIPPDMIHVFCVFLDFCYLVRQDMFDEDTLVLIQDALDNFNHYWDIFQDIGVCPHRFSLPWQHSLCHYCHLIHLFSAPNGHCTSITKSMHKESIKGPWQKSNKCHTDGQILVTNQQQDKIVAACSDFEAQGMLKGMVFTDAYKRAESPDIPGGAIAVDADMQSVNVNHRSDGDEGSKGGGRANDNEVDERKYPSTAQELVVMFHQPNFHHLIRQFLYDQSHLLDPDASLWMDVPLAQCPPFDSCISVYHTMTAVFYSPSDPSGLQGMHQECIRSNLCLDIVQLLVLFSFIWMGVLYPSDKPDEAMGLWVVQPDYNANGSPAIGVIHLDLVLCGAHLMPVFGDSPIPIGLGVEHSLDVFQAFYVNKYINYHAFEITS
ncbi:hypothetical protein EI94DRAFT_1774111 [Lactarius quietus]|nr:hypothetical protein EI94DRAFT_1774111 [Lactarius quietus]